MTFDKLLNVAIIVSLSVSGTNLYRYLQDKQIRTEAESQGLCDSEIVLTEGHFTVLTGPAYRNAGTLLGSDDGCINLVSADGKRIDFTVCLAAGINNGTLKIVSQ